MKEYKLEIEGTFTTTVVIEAKSYKEAVSKATEEVQQSKNLIVKNVCVDSILTK